MIPQYVLQVVRQIYNPLTVHDSSWTLKFDNFSEFQNVISDSTTPTHPPLSSSASVLMMHWVRKSICYSSLKYVPCSFSWVTISLSSTHLSLQQLSFQKVKSKPIMHRPQLYCNEYVPKKSCLKNNISSKKYMVY